MGLPKDLYSLYKSADAHTRKPYTPRMVKVLRWSLAACLLFVVVAIFAARSFWHAAAPVPKAMALAAPKEKSSSVLPSGKKPALTSAEWLAQQIPRVDGVTWSEPLFDDRKAQAEPETYCIATEQRCACISEQGTKIDMAEKRCRSIAQDGLYNPYRRPIRANEGNGMDRRQVDDRLSGELH